MQSAIPMIAYQDGAAALAWLVAALGFREVTRRVGADGRLAHGELDVGDGALVHAGDAVAMTAATGC